MLQRPLILDAFTTSPARCGADKHAKVTVHALARLDAAQAAAAKSLVDVRVDGVSLGAQPVPVQRISPSSPPFLYITRELDFPSVGGQATVDFALNGGLRSTPKRFLYSCLTAKAPLQHAATGLTLPDLAIASSGRPVFIYEPDRSDPNDPCHGAPRGPFGACGAAPPQYDRYWYEIPSWGLVANDLSTTVPLYRLTGNSCPRESDAWVTMQIFIPFTSTGVADPTAVTSAAAVPNVILGGFWQDYRGGAPAVRPGFTQFGAFEWVEIVALLPCTRRGTFEYSLDATNALRESDESNNTIRFTYATVAP